MLMIYLYIYKDVLNFSYTSTCMVYGSYRRWHLGYGTQVTYEKEKKKLPLGYIAHLRSIFPWNAHFEKNYNFTRK